MQVRQIRENLYGAELSEQELAMLEFVGKMTVDSSNMTAGDAQRLREHGFGDVEILEIVQLAAWFNYMTRVADALGVEVEEWRHGWHDYLFGEETTPTPLPSTRGL